MLNIYIDADSLPTQLRAIILKRVMKENLRAVFVADRPLRDVEQAYQEHTALLRASARERGEEDSSALRTIRSPIEMITVPPGQDSADNHLVEIIEGRSLAITHDVPLASRLAAKGAVVLDDRGGVYTSENVGERLSMRNMMGELREMGIFAEQHRPMDGRQIKAFSDAFDSELTKLLKQVGNR